MLTTLLIGFLAISVDAAARTLTEPHQPLPTLTKDVDYNSFLNDKIVEANKKSRQFWQEFDTETKAFEERLQALSQRFPNPVVSEGVEGDKYKIIVSIPNYKQNEIKVATNQKKVLITARHEDADAEDDFQNVISLPDNVEKGTWTYENEILTLLFPLTATTNNDEGKLTESGDDD